MNPQKRLETMKRKAEESGVSMSDKFKEWGVKGSKTTTGGFQNMTEKKHKKASAKGGVQRGKNRQSR